MRRLIIVGTLALAAPGCGTLPGTVRTPELPPGVFGMYHDNDTGAINNSAWAFSSPRNTSGNPQAAIRAIVGLEYLAGELKENPRWIGMDDTVKLRMVQARDDLRGVLGIPKSIDPQAVVDALLRLGADLKYGRADDAKAVLETPVFTLSPELTLKRLSNLPYMEEANLATSRAQAEAWPVGEAG